MSRIQLKITPHTKNQENLNVNEKRKVILTNAEMTHMLEFSNHGFKADMIKMFQRAFVNMLETKEKEKKKRKPQQRNRRYNEELNGNFISEKFNN